MQKWILYACALLIITSIFQILTPNGPLKGVMKFFLNLFFIGLMMTPIFKNMSVPKIKNYFNHDVQTPNNEQIQKNIVQLNKKNLERALKILLEQNGYKNFRVELTTPKQNASAKIIVTFSSKEKIDTKKLKTLIESQTKIEPEIVFK